MLYGPGNEDSAAYADQSNHCWTAQLSEMAQLPNKVERRSLNPRTRYIMQRGALFLAFAVILFVAAGSLDWVRAWVYVIYTVLMETCMLFLLVRKAPDMLNERGRLHAGVKTFDKVFAVAWLALALTTPVVAGFDAVRFGWSSMSMAAAYLGAILMAVGFALGTWAMVANEHFEQFVRIQTERAHRVVTTGPYKVVRHPGYAGAIMGTLATPLLLGTWWTFVPAGAIVLLFIIRTALEDKTLREELEGYEAYAQRTNYRLFPCIW